MNSRANYEAIKNLFAFDNKSLKMYSVYFILGLSNCINKYSVLKDFKAHNVSMSTLSSLNFIPSLPWALKCIIASFSDSVSICGYRRKPYMIIGNFSALLLSLVMLTPYLEVGEFVGVLTTQQTAVVLSDVNYDALLVEECKRLTDAEASRLLLKVKSMRTLGALIGRTLGPVLWSWIGSFGIYIVLAFIYFVALIVSITMPELYKPSEILDLSTVANRTSVSIELNERGERVNYDESEEAAERYSFIKTKRLCQLTNTLASSLSNKYLGPLMLFIIFTGLCPTADLPMFYYLTDELHYTPYTMSLIAFMSEMGKFFGYFLYSTLFMHLRLRTTYFILVISTILIQMLPLLLTTVNPSTVSEICLNNSTVIHNIRQNHTCYLYQEYKLNPVGISVSESFFGEAVNDLFWIPVERVTAIIIRNIAFEATVYASVASIANMTSSVKGFVDMFFIVYFNIDHGNTVNLQKFQLFCIYLEILSFVMAILIPPVSTQQILHALS